MVLYFLYLTIRAIRLFRSFDRGSDLDVSHPQDGTRPS
jgi:hypothetical protein